MLFADYMLQWLGTMRAKVSPTTYTGYQNLVKNSICPYFRERHITLTGLRPPDLQGDYLLASGVSGNTALHHHANIHKALKDAVRLDLVDRNVADIVERPNWSPDIIERHAQAGAESIMMFISHPMWAVKNGAEVVMAIQAALDKGPEFRALAYIYGVYELSNGIPPYGILQHAVNDGLMRVYCTALKKCLAFCLEGESASQQQTERVKNIAH